MSHCAYRVGLIALSYVSCSISTPDGFLAPDPSETLHRFLTRPDIVAPIWDLKIHNGSALAPGYWFVAPYWDLERASNHKWNGPLIYDRQGQLVWSGAPVFKYLNAFDFRAVEVEGKQMVSLIIHDTEAGYILDNTYELHETINMVSDDLSPWLRHALGDQKKTNFHEFSIIENGSRMLMLTREYENSTIEESRLVGFEGHCNAKYEGFKEVDIAVMEPVFAWSAHGHIGLDESTWSLHNITSECTHEYPDGWGFTHLNSVDKFPDGDYLVSARHTDAIYKISNHDGSVIWRLGGVKSDFVFEDGETRFSRQHHARVLSQNKTHTVISLFDNAHSANPDDPPSNSQSRGLVVALRTNTRPMAASVVQKFIHPDALAVTRRGSVQILPNKNVFVCWSQATALTEHAPDGKLLMEVKFRLDAAGSYRGYKFPWIGKPVASPDVHAVVSTCGNHACTIVHVSWNGATEVATWNVYKTQANGESAQLVYSALRSGFETRIVIYGHTDYVLAEALDLYGNALGRSKICKTTLESNYSRWGGIFVALLVGFVSGIVTIVAIRMLRWRSAERARYGLLSVSDHDEDSEPDEDVFLSEEDEIFLDSLSLKKLVPGADIDLIPQPCSSQDNLSMNE